jgi:deazaflavin-dependent oxidoreductase (nitroreductase family)
MKTIVHDDEGMSYPLEPKDVDRPMVSDHDALRREPIRTRRLPPRWFIRSFWVIHRALHAVSGGRFGLRSARVDRWGMLRLRTVGRRTGEERTAILGYLEDGPNLVTLAMNGWADPEPAWWLNLQAHPDARIDLTSGSRTVRARAAHGDERARLWAMWVGLGEGTDAYAALRSGETAVVILEPRLERGHESGEAATI